MTLADFQKKTADRIFEVFRNGQKRVLLADEVGLGKTIEACSILKIFLSKKTGKNILIVVPTALAAQWKTELLFKFGILEGENENDHFLCIETIHSIIETKCK